jgi:hypothetical protein
VIWGLAEDQGLRNGGGGDQRLGLDVLHLNVWRQRIGDDEQGLVGWNCQASAANDYNSCDIRFFDSVSFSGQLWPGNGWFNFSTGNPYYFGDAKNDKPRSFQIT